MAKEELLRILMLRFLRRCLHMLLIMSSISVYAQYELDGGTLWAQNIASMAIREIDFTTSMDEENQHPNLQIFVSSSMPESVLTNLAREASKYDGVLVFRGLPNGSMMELSSLVMRISDKDYPAAMQIDDEAFALYSIDRVPSFVLSKTKSGLSGSVDATSSQLICMDKMVGNVLLSVVLEEFAKSGDCREFAANLLHVSGR